ncbi:MAG TPA: HD domain-containing phosphohydrolase [Candidatus Baltobacteraceae bacterium]|nr:HD domain-containing phosphohydrolase [Candidatus Baltobacteraceae bacterium]
MVVLTVDDSDINLAVYRSVLARIDGVEIAGFTSPLEALDWTKEHPVDVAVVDYHMPQLDGVGFIVRLREMPSAEHTLAVMVTSDAEPEVRRAALLAGANDFLTKPIDQFEFTARMRNMLEVASSRRKLADRAEWLHTEVERATAVILDREIETIARLTRTAEFRDDVTGMHVVRVGHMCAALARTIGLRDEDCRQLLLAAPMHDIGKVSTPDAILLKPARLDADEMEIMKHHTTAGYEILKNSKSPMLQTAAEIALTHHERYDGGGYPRGLRGSEIPLSGRLCSVVDVFDALTSVRPYKDAWPIEDALANIREGGGSQFDPELVQIFDQSLDDVLAIKRRFSDDKTGDSAYHEWWRM